MCSNTLVKVSFQDSTDEAKEVKKCREQLSSVSLKVVGPQVSGDGSRLLTSKVYDQLQVATPPAHLQATERVTHVSARQPAS